MTRHHRRVMAAAGMLLALSAAPAALAQKSRGVLRQYIIDSPASMSIHEETTVVAERPMMAVMSNLVLFDQHVPQNSLSDILPDLATDWAWDEDGTRLTLHLRQGVKWHDGKPFTAADVKCTWDLVQGDEGSVQFVRLGHRGTPSRKRSDEVSTSSPPAP